MDPPNSHKLCVLCSGFSTQRRQLLAQGVPYCEDLPMKVLRTRLNIALGCFLLQCPTAGKEPQVVVLPSLTTSVCRREPVS